MSLQLTRSLPSKIPSCVPVPTGLGGGFGGMQAPRFVHLLFTWVTSSEKTIAFPENEARP